MKSSIKKGLDSAIGSSFGHHVLGGYRFLMRFYSPGDEIYIFGFSRGAYIARFLAEMLDYVGLLSHGNEEMVGFAWKAFSSWQSRSPDDLENKKKIYQFMKDFRETFSRPVRRIRYLGLFDTVNSVPHFEAAWMQRSKFPYTARTSAKVIRHAVSIDERRAKFRQDLIYQSDRSKGKSATPVKDKLHDMTDKYRKKTDRGTGDGGRGRRPTLAVPEVPAPYRRRSRSGRSPGSRATGQSPEPGEVPQDRQSEYSFVAPHPHGDGDDSDSMASEDSDEHYQDIDEVWFAGGHGDIGGGWDLVPGSRSKAASHIPLVWMVREAMKAGLTFDLVKVREMGCAEALDEVNPAQQPAANATTEDGGEIWHNAEAQPVPEITFQNSFSAKGESSKENEASQPVASEVSNNGGAAQPLSFHEMLHQCHHAGIHDSLQFDCGLHWSTVLSWKIMEYIPFRRMDLSDDGSWKPIRWPLPCGEVRDIPANARVHGSVIRRMELNEKYRPGNLIIGGGGRGVRVASADAWKPDEWECVAEKGDPVGEIWVRKCALEKGDGPVPGE